ncbi:MAG: hypothetical protein ACUVQG_13065, partial [Thermogutta sp.]
PMSAGCLLARLRRVAQKVTFLFHCLATQIASFPHPKPKVSPRGFFATGRTPVKPATIAHLVNA